MQIDGWAGRVFGADHRPRRRIAKNDLLSFMRGRDGRSEWLGVRLEMRQRLPVCYAAMPLFRGQERSYTDTVERRRHDMDENYLIYLMLYHAVRRVRVLSSHPPSSHEAYLRH